MGGLTNMKDFHELQNVLLGFQKNEITEFHIYRKLAHAVGTPENRKILEKIAEDELEHYHYWEEQTRQEVKPRWLQVWLYFLISRVFGITFGIKLMERGEAGAQENYAQLKGKVENIEQFIEDENVHEMALISLIEEDHLRYVGSIVLGLNDALMELTGVLAGLTLALQNTKLIALTGSITGIAAALSMGASEYLSTKSEGTHKNPIRASVYTGSAYILTVLVLILPYLVFENYYVSLGLTLTAALLVIALFNYYIAIVRDEPFLSRFVEMAGLSLGVAGFSFLVGYAIRSILGIEV